MRKENKTNMNLLCNFYLNRKRKKGKKAKTHEEYICIDKNTKSNQWQKRGKRDRKSIYGIGPSNSREIKSLGLIKPEESCTELWENAICVLMHLKWASIDQKCFSS